MKLICPNCGAKVKKLGSQDTSRGHPYKLPDVFLCGTSTSENWPKPLIRCTKGENSFKKIKLIWLNKFSQKIEHNLFDCSVTYAKEWWAKNIMEGKNLEIVV